MSSSSQYTPLISQSAQQRLGSYAAAGGKQQANIKRRQSLAEALADLAQATHSDRDVVGKASRPSAEPLLEPYRVAAAVQSDEEIGGDQVDDDEEDIVQTGDNQALSITLAKPGQSSAEQQSWMTGILILATISASLSPAFSGYALASINATLHFISRDIGFAGLQADAFVAAFPLGGLLGCILAPFLAELTFLGRKRVIWLGNLLSFFACMVFIFSSSFAALLSARVLQGIGCGVAVNVCGVFLAEISPLDLRSTLGIVMTRFSFALGICFAFVLEAFVPWRVALASGAVLLALQTVTLPFIPSSPVWLLRHEKELEARNSLRKLRGAQDVDQELSFIEDTEINADVSDIVDEEQAGKTGIAARFSLFLMGMRVAFSDSEFRRSLFVSLFLSFSQVISGFAALVLYGVSIFRAASIPRPNMIMAISSICFLAGSILAIGTVQRLGRRAHLLLGLAGQIVCMALMAVLYAFGTNLAIPSGWLGFGIVSAAFGFMGSYGVASGTLPWLIVAELFEGELVRNIVTALCQASNWAGLVIVAAFQPLLTQALGPYVFMLLVAVNVATFLFAAVFLRETRIPTVADVEEV